MRSGINVCFASLVVAWAFVHGFAQGPKKPVLTIACVDQQKSYAPSETVNLTVTIENRGKGAFYVYQPLEWGWTGLFFGLLDATGKSVPWKNPVLEFPPPPPPKEKTDFVEVDPGYFYGRNLDFRLGEYKLNPGKYFIEFKYHGNYHESEGFGLPILASEDGEITSNRIEISVR